MTMFTVEAIAKVAHEANRAFCETIGDNSQLKWEDAADWQKQSAIDGVKFRLERPDASAASQHEAWLHDKLAAGWTYGSVKDPEKKEHPCIVSYDKLPIEQRMKDYLFAAVVGAFRDIHPAEAPGSPAEPRQDLQFVQNKISQ